MSAKTIPTTAQQINPIPKHIRKMDSESLATFVAVHAHSIAEQLEGLQPYYIELRERFHHIKKGESILSCHTWTEYCDKILNRTRRAINYWLSGGNPASNRLLPAGDERETVSHSLPVSDSTGPLEDRFEETLAGAGTPQLREAIERLTSNHLIIGTCETDKCTVFIEPYASTEGEFYIVAVIATDDWGEVSISGTKTGIAKRAVAYFVDHAIGDGSELQNRMVYEVRGLWPDYQKKKYNDWLYPNYRTWLNKEVLGKPREQWDDPVGSGSAQ